MELKAEDRLILSCIKINPTLNELEQINDLIPEIQNWEYLISTIIDRGIGPLLHKKLPLLTNSLLIPETVKTKLNQVYYKTFSRSTILYDHFRKIAEAFVSQNIPLIALKGIYLSEWLYQDIGLRQFSDIDLLVKEEDSAKCITILSDFGYKTSESDMSEFVLAEFENDIVHYAPMVLHGVSIELHINLHRKTEKYKVIIPVLWENSIPASVNGMQIKALNTNDLLIHLCLHLDKHFWIGKVQFTCFNDITNVLEQFSNIMNWSEFIESCKFYKCDEIVFKYIVLIHKYMNAFVPSYIIHKYKFLLMKRDEHLFCCYLKGSLDTSITLSAHIGYLKNVHSFFDKVRYLRDILFPSKAFMIQRYQIKNSTYVLLYYPYRYYIGIMGVLNYLKRKVVFKN